MLGFCGNLPEPAARYGDSHARLTERAGLLAYAQSPAKASLWRYGITKKGAQKGASLYGGLQNGFVISL